MKTSLITLYSCLVALAAQADPQLTSWFTSESTKYARLYATDANRVAGNSVTTWSNGQESQSLPAYAGVQTITYSSNWIYLSTPDLPPYIMGPWYNDASRTTPFVNLPKNQSINYRIPRTATLPTPPATKSQTAGQEDSVGYFVDGVAMFDPTDGFSYANGTESSPGTGQWHRDAYVNEKITFDPGNTHQQNTGKYHNHADPLALRYLMGDHIDYDPSSKLYTESTTAPAAHSPILGWVRDGYPIYGPYGYSSPMDATSGIRRMVSGFVLRNGSTPGVDSLTASGRTLPAWALRNNGNISASGPAVSTTYPLGRYIEDSAYLGDLTNPNTGGTYKLGTDFDLNEYNVRYCVTPEFPNGTYAYFMCITSNGAPAVPYNLNRYFFGSPTGGTATAAETVATYFQGGPSLQEVAEVSTVDPSTGNVTLTWSSTEGGTYKVEANSNLTAAWTTLSSTQAAASGTVVTDYVDPGAATVNNNRFYRVTRTALASYDTGSTVTTGSTITTSPASGNRGTTVTVTATISNSASPTVPPQNAGVQSFTIGSLSGTNLQHVSQYVVSAQFVIPSAYTPTGAQSVVITFSPPQGQTSGPSYTQASGFTVNSTPSSQAASKTAEGKVRRAGSARLIRK